MKKGFLIFALAGLPFFSPPLHAEDIASGLAGIAGNIAGPVSEMVVAGIQAGANKEVAKINAGAEVRKTEIMADVQSDANKKAAEVELYRTKTAAEIAAINQNGLTERQALISMESIIATKEKYAAQREQQWMDYEFNIAKLIREDKSREQQLALEKQYRDLQTAMGILAPSGTNGGLQITRFGQAPLDSNATSTATNDPAGADPTQEIAANSAQSRLTRNLSTRNLAQKITSFRGGKSVVRAANAPQFTLAANNVKLSTPLVRGSRNSQLLTINDETPAGGKLLVARAFTSKRAAYAGVGHGAIGRRAEGEAYPAASQPSGIGAFASNDSGNGPTHRHTH